MRTLFLLSVGLFVATCGAPPPAFPQTIHPDVQLIRTAGAYKTCCMTPADLDLSLLCYERTDLMPAEDLGCFPALAPDTKHCYELTVSRTTFIDAEIRCYVEDKDQNKSELSDNKGDVDFTPPGKAHVTK